MEHKDLDAWKNSMDLVVLIYEITKGFSEEEKFGLTQQMRRCAVSVPSNIAEGCARKGDAETIQFLYIATGSLAELETQALIAERLQYANMQEVLQKITTSKKCIIGLIKYLKQK